MLKRFVARVAAIMLSGTAMAGPLEDSEAAYWRQDYATALRLIRPMAEQGDAKAQYNLGVMYAEGEGVPQDLFEAVRYFRQAAEQGDARAQYNLGVMIMYREGVDPGGASPPYPNDHRQFSMWLKEWEQSLDYAGAARWWRLSAKQGFVKAHRRLGYMYDEGKGVPQDYAEAAWWYRQAAEQGDAEAQYNLGNMYEYGEGVPQDLTAAEKWYRLAAEQCPPSRLLCPSGSRRIPMIGGTEGITLPPGPLPFKPGPRPSKRAAAPPTATVLTQQHRCALREFTGGGVVVAVSCRRIAGQEVPFITVKGEFQFGDEKFFEEALLTVTSPVAIVSLASPGGNLHVGMDIGQKIWSSRFSTVVEGSVCASACALAWLAGRPRYASLDAQIGFHAPTRADDPGRKVDAAGSAVVGAYLNQLGFTTPAIIYMNQRDPTDMNWLTSSEAQDLGIYVEAWPQ